MVFTCTICGYSTDSKSKLNAHIKKQIPCYKKFDIKQDFELCCSFCNNSFSNKRNMINHMDNNCVAKSRLELVVQQVQQYKELSTLKQKKIEELLSQIKNINQKVNDNKKEYEPEDLDNESTNTEDTDDEEKNIIEPYAFRTADMMFAIDKLFLEEPTMAKKLCREINYFARKDSIYNVLRTMIRFLHNNYIFRRGLNICYSLDERSYVVYCPDYISNLNTWHIIDTSLVMSVFSKELIKIMQYMDKEHIYTPLEYSYVECLEHNSRCIEYVQNIVSGFHLVKQPSNVSKFIFKHNIPKDEAISRIVMSDKKRIIYDNSDDEDSADTHEQKILGTYIRKSINIIDDDS